jgi:signal transduction histidine kinase
MIALSEDLLTEARLEAGLFRLQLERVDIRGLARGVVADLRRLYPRALMFDAPRAGDLPSSRVDVRRRLHRAREFH